jgi:hypothetical protein
MKMERLPDEALAVTASLGYLGEVNGRPYDYAYPPPSGAEWRNYRSDTRSVSIGDARRLASAPSLATEGFELCDVPTALSAFDDEPAISRTYYPEIAELARAMMGARSAYVFDHLVRKREQGAAPLTFGRRVSGSRPSANGRVHNDYTELSGPRRMAQVLGDDAVRARRFAIVNVWRPISEPLLDAPLALCDARSVEERDLVTADVHYATRTGEIYLVTYSPQHRWFYYPAMRRREVLVFKQYDSLVSAPRFVPHAAFEDPHTPPNAPPRESIEARCLVVF